MQLGVTFAVIQSLDVYSKNEIVNSHLIAGILNKLWICFIKHWYREVGYGRMPLFSSMYAPFLSERLSMLLEMMVLVLISKSQTLPPNQCSIINDVKHV